MDSYYIIDSHCDTLEKIGDHGIEGFHDGEYHVSPDGLKQGRVGIQFFAAFVGPKSKTGPCLQRGLKLIDAYYTMLRTYPDSFTSIRSSKDIGLAIEQKKVGALLAVEGGDILEGELLNLRILYQLGVRAMTLTWNHRNELADGALESASLGGLSLFGREVVVEMNRLGMLIDVSHLSEKGFYDLMETTNYPVAATHSNAWSVHAHPRNLRDNQIQSLAKAHGVIGINFYPPFLTEKQASMKDILRHIEYVSALVGTDILGFGSDFDGIAETPDGIRGPEDYDKIINALLQLNYSETDVKKMAFENYNRLLHEILTEDKTI